MNDLTQSYKEEIYLPLLMQKPEGTKLFVSAGCSVQCSRGKVGEVLYRALPEFNLKLNVWSYNSLHEKHLRKYFNNPSRKKLLIDRGLITEDGQVLCSIREFNQYIDYLKTVNLEWDKALQQQETPEITRTKEKAEKKEQRVKPGSNTQTHTLDSSVFTVESDHNSVNDLNLDLLQISEEQEESCQNEADASVEMPIKKKINIAGLTEKPDRCSMQYSRGKVGKSLHQVTTEFDLRDPNIKQNPWKYNNLHDKHLKKFFNKPGRRKQLIKQGLITEDEYVLCSQKEFNQYVDYQKSIKPKPDELLLPDVSVSLPPVEPEEVDTCSTRLEVTSSETTEEPSKDDIPAGPKKNKSPGFSCKVVKRVCTRRGPKICPDS